MSDDAHRILLLPSTDAHGHRALGNPRDQALIVKALKVDVGATGQPELNRTDVKLGATAFADKQVVARRDRVITRNRSPVLALIGELNVAGEFGESSNASRRISRCRSHHNQRGKCGGAQALPGETENIYCVHRSCAPAGVSQRTCTERD